MCPPPNACVSQTPLAGDPSVMCLWSLLSVLCRFPWWEGEVMLRRLQLTP